uniref:Cellular communication network factor 5 n=1 Tax=Monopterus albus TaxID=43700 RepID=A0A3Q3K221_MONAL
MSRCQIHSRTKYYLCTGPCRCLPTVLHCPVSVPLMSESCGCCQLCTQQEGEACTNQLPCDTRRGLRCDYSASFPGGPGQCQSELRCEMNGRRLEDGQVFQPSCSQLCHCIGGGVTCIPLCSEDLHRPTDKCPNPQLVRLPGRCCKEWVCAGVDNSISSHSSLDLHSKYLSLHYLFPAEQEHQDYRGGPSGLMFGPSSNCIKWTSDWSPCSYSCGPGVSTRTTNRNWACRLQTETRLCQVRPCYTLKGKRGRSYSSPISVQLEHQGCWSTRAYRIRFCALTCPVGHCCSPSHTRTVQMVFRCPQGRLIQQQVMMIESCFCSTSTCRQSPSTCNFIT